MARVAKTTKETQTKKGEQKMETLISFEELSKPKRREIRERKPMKKGKGTRTDEEKQQQFEQIRARFLERAKMQEEAQKAKDRVFFRNKKLDQIMPVWIETPIDEFNPSNVYYEIMRDFEITHYELLTNVGRYLIKEHDAFYAGMPDNKDDVYYEGMIKDIKEIFDKKINALIIAPMVTAATKGVFFNLVPFENWDAKAGKFTFENAEEKKKYREDDEIKKLELFYKETAIEFVRPIIEPIYKAAIEEVNKYFNK